MKEIKYIIFISSSRSGTVINYGSGSGSDFLTSYGSSSGSVPLVKKLRFLQFLFRFRFHTTDHDYFSLEQEPAAGKPLVF